MSYPSSKLFLHDHPVSSYAQKIRLALREKDIPFDKATPKSLGSGQAVPDLESANPRIEVPALEDGDFKIFDSTIIMAYLEEKYPATPLLPQGAKARAEARMIEEVVDTHYEAINWGYGEVVWAQRATGDLKDKLLKEIASQTSTIQLWLAEKLGDKPYFNGDVFGYADICVAPVLNRSVHYGLELATQSLVQWLARIKDRQTVNETFAEMEEGAKNMSAMMKQFFVEGPGKREYRDHRLEWMIKSGGLSVVEEGLKKGNVRFGWPRASF
ncbi:Glutathione S-transferase [Teratosphaeria destructans]|uniref:Glutathione S-transferase n=1 Tax=Teratosphaeria destructans TaxID=418781 RepID=A0A9W7VYS1_9PEZI|nr:Glutathione S-transferase [Teratosphaeria destructans]